MKKLLICILMIFMTFALCSCGQNDKADKEYKYQLNISKTSISLEKDDQTVLFANYTDNKTKVTFETTDETVAIVDKNGTITAIGAGTCYIIASADGQEKACVVTVTEPKYTLELVYTDANYLFVGVKTVISAIAYKDGVKYNGEITWSVNDRSICTLETLDDGNVVFSANSAGTYIVKAEIANVSAQCTFFVLDIGD